MLLRDIVAGVDGA